MGEIGIANHGGFEPNSPSRVQIHAALAPKISLAFYQNSVPILRELAIANNKDHSLRDVELTLFSEPAFVKPKTWRIDSIGEGQLIHFQGLDLDIDGTLLNRLTEAEKAQATFLLKARDEEIVQTEIPIELLARNQWGGIGHVPEMIAAFIQPNEDAVARLLKQSAEVLRKHGKNSALNGYSEGPKRAWEMVSAIWTAVSAMGLDYVLPPASFENGGQKIRGANQITETGLATCLDTTLLFCSAIEQCGLNPLVVVTQGHAFAGVWLKDEEFSTPVVDDITALRKRIKLNELVLFETTLVTQRPCPPFGRATERGAQQVSETEEHTFELVVDVRRARLQRIKPLASVDFLSQPAPQTSPEALEPIFEDAPDIPEEGEARPVDANFGQPKDRLDRWQRKLLDLSLRNRLLNFKATKTALRLEAPDAGLLEDLLADGHVIKLLPRPDLMDGHDPRNLFIHESRSNEDLRRTHALDSLKRKEVFVSMPLGDLEARLTELYRSARLNLQEGGANTLYLSIGFLTWNRDEKDGKKYRAPLILIPVSLNRKSVRSGFSLVRHDDEPRFNPTLLEMLRQDFKLTLPVADGELPKDDHGLDVAGIWKSVAQSVKDIHGWEVIEEVVLASFSFAKYLMWKDLVDRTEQLKENPVVRHLIDTPRETYPSPVPFPKPRELDTTCGLEQTFCPLPADSSQLSAVMAAARGKDFVLEGPPGTGKSQTIANLIAQCLAERKTVLFVSAKMAALDVVYRRLRDVGLGDFCLELHSNKAKKLEVLDQLRKAWEARGGIDATQWRREAQRLTTLRDHLNTYVEHLHRKHRNGLSAFSAMSRLVAERDSPTLQLSWPSPDAHDMDDLDALRELAERLDINAKAVGTISNCPLTWIAQGEWSPQWQSSIIQGTKDLLSISVELEKSANDFLRAASFPSLQLDSRIRGGLGNLARELPKAAGHNWRFILRPDFGVLSNKLREGSSLVNHHRELFSQLPTPYEKEVIHNLKHGNDLLNRYRKITSQLSVTYKQEAFQLAAVQLQTEWSQAGKTWWPMRLWKLKKVRSVIRSVVQGQQEPDITADLDHLVELRELEAEINALEYLRAKSDGLWKGLATDQEAVNGALALQEALLALLVGRPWNENSLEVIESGRSGTAMRTALEQMKELRALETELAEFRDFEAKTDGLWKGLKTNLEEVEKALAFQARLFIAIASLTNNPEVFSTIKNKVDRLLGDDNSLLEPTGPVAQSGAVYCDVLERFRQTLDGFSHLLGRNPGDQNINQETPQGLAQLCRQILPLESKLRAWCAWRKACSEALVRGLAPLVEEIESGRTVLGQVLSTFNLNYCRWWLNAMVDSDDVLRSFVSAEHEKRIADFKALDDRFIELTRAYVRAGLCGELPDQASVGRNTEWGVLRHEIQKKKRHLPLRELVNRLPNILTKLAPCVLMSPLSIAQYLSADTTPFDVVVFDEASQIPVWDAVGAIARGKQVVIVGDPKQLPPTAFFDRAEGDMDDEDVEGDLESILDECLGANLPTLNLAWHYRSRHESLIAFSNHRYYGGGLVTFPSPVTEDRAVSFHHVSEGIYEKGGARINQREAMSLVSDIMSRLKSPAFKASGLTIGVVTFNSEQQHLIENILDEERRKDPSIESFFTEDALEPVFVKNLESVQGDERDIMYFSITYGPDRTGAISMNFGPMNRNGGERRLNVAITRARHELRVFSSLKPEQIDLSRTQAVGVRDMKHFLEFADRGPRALAEAVFGTIGDFESPFEQAVAEALAAKGWQVHSQVGVSSFRIDLGVVDPDAPGRYLVGIECDGATYHRSATARDRDKLREQVLRGLGWEILRIWSTDWWVNAQDALEKIHGNIESLLEKSRSKHTEPALQLEVPTLNVPPEVDQEDNSGPSDGFPLNPSTKTVFQEPVNPIKTQVDTLVSTLTFAHLNILNEVDRVPFREADLTSVEGLSTERFFDDSYNTTLKNLIEHVVMVEGPIREDVLVVRIARAHGWARTGARIKDRVLSLIGELFPTSQEDVGRFLWPPGIPTDYWKAFRPSVGETVRPVDEISFPELVALARAVKAKNIKGEEAVVVMGREIGLMKFRTATRERLLKALENDR